MMSVLVSIEEKLYRFMDFFHAKNIQICVYSEQG